MRSRAYWAAHWPALVLLRLSMQRTRAKARRRARARAAGSAARATRAMASARCACARKSPQRRERPRRRHRLGACLDGRRRGRWCVRPKPSRPRRPRRRCGTTPEATAGRAMTPLQRHRLPRLQQQHQRHQRRQRHRFLRRGRSTEARSVAVRRSGPGIMPGSLRLDASRQMWGSAMMPRKPSSDGYCSSVFTR